MLDLKRLKRFAEKTYRDSYLESRVRSSIALQIQALRAKLELTQEAFALAIAKKQSVVSRLEDVDYGRVSVQTLLDIAKSLDIALIVRFVDYERLIGESNKTSVSALQPDNIFESISRAEASNMGNKSELASWTQSTISIQSIDQPKPHRLETISGLLELAAVNGSQTNQATAGCKQDILARFSGVSS